jgi:hypothetical protein
VSSSNQTLVICAISALGVEDTSDRPAYGAVRRARTLVPIEVAVDAGGAASFLHMLGLAAAAIERSNCRGAVLALDVYAANGWPQGGRGWTSSDRESPKHRGDPVTIDLTGTRFDDGVRLQDGRVSTLGIPPVACPSTEQPRGVRRRLAKIKDAADGRL